MRRRVRLLPANEAKIKDLKVDSVFQTKWRATHQDLRPTYKTTDKNGIVYFICNSGTQGPVQKWHQKVQLCDLQAALDLQKKDPSITDRDVVNLAVFGDIRVFCDDLSFKYYGWKYMAWQLDYGMEPEDRPPDKRNPRLHGAVCKHLYAVLSVLPFHLSEITRDLSKAGVFQSE